MKKFPDCGNYGQFKPKDITQLLKNGGITGELDQEKVTVDIESIEGVERKRTYAEVLSKIVTNTAGTN